MKVLEIAHGTCDECGSENVRGEKLDGVVGWVVYCDKCIEINS